MAVIKCKMCGGDLLLTEGSTVAECEYCGSVQTVPTADNEKKLTLFARANRLRAANEFDKAAGVYESIVVDFPEEAEAYWGLVLCKFGIEYVDDPATGKKVPTCHRSGFDSVMKDADFEQACENADPIARRVYREEAKQIEEIRRRIIEVSGKEEPYDIFICYKETDSSGKRTVDSVIAQNVYDKLTESGYRVFFSRITLEDKLGTEYEPYIFAALNSAKVMLVFGTDYEHFNAVWVKNEWSRFLKLMAADKTKYLIPCYKDIDAYDMPEEFAHLQAQDMGKVGAEQDLIRGIKKLLPKEEPKQEPAQQTVVQQVVQGGANAGSLIKRAFMFLEDGDFSSADEYAEKALDLDPECADGYLVKLLAKYRLHNEEEIVSAIEKRASVFEAERKKEVRVLSCGRYYNKLTASGGLGLTNAGVEKFIASLPRDVTVTEPQYKMLQRAFDVEILYDVTEPIEESPLYLKFMRFAPADSADRIRAIVKKGVESLEDIERRKAEEEEALAEQQRLEAEQQRLKAEQQRLEAERKREETIIRLKPARERIMPAQNLISAGCYHTACVKDGGTAGATKYTGVDNHDQCNVAGWKDIVAISAGLSHTVGLKADGTVVATKYTGNQKYNHGQCEVGDWKDIIAISAGNDHTVGLRADGTVVATKYTGDQANDHGQCEVSGWRNIIAVSAGSGHTVGLKADGTVVATKYTGDQKYYAGRCEVGNWKNIVAVSAGYFHTVGLKADGTVVSTQYKGDPQFDTGQCKVGGWKDIIAISAGLSHTVGLRADGTVVATKYTRKYYQGQCEVTGWKWKDIVAISAGRDHTVGLKADGTVVATILNSFYSGQCEVGGWKLFNSIDTLAQEQEAAKERRKQQLLTDLTAAQQKKAAAEAELPTLKGLFAGKRRKELEAEIASAQRTITEAAAQLNKLG